MKKMAALALLAFALAGCKTIGIYRAEGGYAEIAPTVANEMIIDTNQVVVLDIRAADAYRGPAGHIAGAINAPFDTIERQLPELLPYQNNTVLVYGENETDGALAAKLLSVAGFRNVVAIDGGIQAWIEKGYRTVNAQ
ncbi:MAG: rhodanese-like domain-containing protein [Acidobacteria bacterium]|nr:rhodanese-like domain-containing protein [Acidobacteriota bacterium]